MGDVNSAVAGPEETEVYPLRLEHSRNRYWVNGHPIDRNTFIAIRGFMGNPKVRPDFDHWIATGEWRFEEVA